MPGTKGRLSEAIRRVLMRRARVAANEVLAGRFRLITLEGAALRDIDWQPGQKVQIAIGVGLATRTYTPIDWNGTAGRTRLLGYAHGSGPGSDWLTNAAPADVCDLFGPRSSLDTRRMDGPFAVFGDETSLGLAASMTGQNARTTVIGHFEVDDPKAAEDIAVRLGPIGSVFFARKAGDAQISSMENALLPLATSGADFVITGKSLTIQRLRQRLKQLGVHASRITTKAYWAPGKTGLD